MRNEELGIRNPLAAVRNRAASAPASACASGYSSTTIFVFFVVRASRPHTTVLEHQRPTRRPSGPRSGDQCFGSCVRYSVPSVRFPDHFSGVAAEYASFRPEYPAELFDWLASVSRQRELAWDCACGSGQAANQLAERFALVVASDASAIQVAAAAHTERIRYLVAPAEPAPLATGTIDLIVVAQALHWFVGEPFYAEVRRVVRSGGVFAAWTYALPHFVSEHIEKRVHHFIGDLLGPYWPDEIRHVLDGYQNIDLPCAEIETPQFEMRADWTLERFLAFARTWSGVRRYCEVHDEDPVSRLGTELKPLFGNAGAVQPVSWRIDLRACRCE